MSSTRTLTISNGDLIEVRRALNVIETGRPCTVGGKDTHRDWILPWSVRMHFATLDIRAKSFLKAFDKENTRLRRMFATQPVKNDDGTEGFAVPAERQGAYEESVQDLIDCQVTITDVPTITMADLNAGDVKDAKNPWPVSTIAELRHVIVDHPGRSKAADDNEEAVAIDAVALAATTEDAPGSGEEP
jgi:hypothetical protein